MHAVIFLNNNNNNIALLYAVAVHLCRVRGFTVNFISPVSYQNTRKYSSCDTLHKLQSKVNALRGDLSIIAELVKGNTSLRVAKKFRFLKRIHKFDRAVRLDDIKCDLTMKLGVLTQKLRRAKRRQKQYEQNNLFTTNTKTFFRQLGNKEIRVSEIPPLDQNLEFWKGIWDSFNDKAGWLEREKYQVNSKTS